MQLNSNPIQAGESDRSVRQVHPVNFYAVEYLMDGKPTQTVVMVMADQVYFPKNHEEWTRSLTTAYPWFNKQVLEKIKRSLPKEDAVDVLG